MMRRAWGGASVALAMFLSGSAPRAADHRDWPGYSSDSAADITDVYSWMSADGGKVYLVLDVQGANLGPTASTKFSDAVQYVFHLGSGATMAGATGNPETIICKFDNATPQNFQCWGPGGEYVKDAIGNTAGKPSTSGKMKVFAGVRDDPFYFNIRGFEKLGATIKSVAGALTFDASGCPTIDATTSMTMVNTLKSDGNAGPAKDDFGKNGLSPLPPGTGGMTNGNVLAIVVAIDKTLLNKGGKIVSIWASTNK